MKILHVIPSVGPLRGGPSFAIRSIAKGLNASGVETHVATTDDNGPHERLDVQLSRPLEEYGATYWYFRRESSFYSYSSSFTGWMWRSASNYDFIHVHSLFSYCSNMAAYIASRLGVPYAIRPLGVLNRWGMQQRRPWLKRASFALIEKHLLESAAFVHYTAEQERIEALECGFRDRPMIIPNPVEVPDPAGARGELRRLYPELAARRVVLFLSRIDRKKGLDLLIPAFAGVVREMPEAALLIAGDGDSKLIEALQERSRVLGIGKSVYWAGFVNGAAKAAMLGEADVFALPSYSENFGIAPVEAMSLGAPVILTDQVGIFREVEANRAGLVTPTDADSLRAAMLRLLGDDRLRAEMGRNGSELARTQFAPSVVIGKLIRAYRSVLSPTEPEEIESAKEPLDFAHC